MKVAFLNGIIGLTLCLLLGIEVLAMSPLEVFLCVLVSNLAALGGLFFTLYLERTPWAKATVVRGGLRTWGVLAVFYLTPLLGLFPVLRDIRAFLFMLIPLILSAGFSLILFGPAQDLVISREQRLKRKSK